MTKVHGCITADMYIMRDRMSGKVEILLFFENGDYAFMAVKVVK